MCIFLFLFLITSAFSKMQYKMGDSYLFFPYSKEDIWREEEVSCLRLSTDEAMHDAR